MDSPKKFNAESSKHFIVQDIRIGIRCGSTDIVIGRETLTCNDCNSILCYEQSN